MTFLIIAFSLLAALYLINLYGIKTREGKPWIIKKGDHFVEKYWFPVVLKRRKQYNYTLVYFKIDQSMLHDHPGTGDDEDWNKITGEGMLDMDSLDYAWSTKEPPHHANSWRLGWSYNPATPSVRLAIYWYKNGLRYSEQIHEFYWSQISNKEFILQVSRQPMSTVFNLYTKGYKTALGKTVEIDKDYSGWTYRLRPYYGGNMPAPTDCRVEYSFDPKF